MKWIGLRVVPYRWIKKSTSIRQRLRLLSPPRESAGAVGGSFRSWIQELDTGGNSTSSCMFAPNISCHLENSNQDGICRGNHRRTTIATQSGISTCIKLSPRQRGLPSPPAVLSTVISAIVGACWIDSNRKFRLVKEVMNKLGLATIMESILIQARVRWIPSRR